MRRRQPTRPIRDVITTMRFSGELMRRITAVARSQGRSRSDLVNHILETYLKRRPAGEPVETDDGTIFG